MDVFAPLVAHLEAPVAVQPRDRVVRSSTHLCRPSRSLESTPRRAMRLLMALFLSAFRHSGRNRSPCRRAASSGACAGGQACPAAARGSAGSRPRPPRASSSRGRWPPIAPPRAGRPLGRPQGGGASSPVCRDPSGWGRPFRPPGAGTTPPSRARPAPSLCGRPRPSGRAAPRAVAPIPRRLRANLGACASKSCPRSRNPSLSGQHLPGDARLEHERDAG